MENSKVPLLKFLIPLITGIVLWNLQVPITIAYIIVSLGIMLLMMPLLPFLKKYKPYTFTIAFFLISASLSWIYTNELLKQDKAIPKNVSIIYAKIEELEQKDVSMNVVATMIGTTDSNYNKVEIELEKILLTIKRNDYSIIEGTIIAFKAALEPIKNMGNPYEFDYAGYMRKKGIRYRQLIEVDGYKQVGYDASMLNHATQIRNILIRKTLESELAPSSQEFLISILLGDKSYLSKDTQLKFDNIGMAHVLALSGLHLAIIGMIIFFLLFPIDYIGGRTWRIVITDIILIIYAYVTGCAPSVIRALIMAIMASIALISYRRYHIGNAICAAAILILLYNPADLLEVGFQLSFIAIISIIIFMPLLNPFSPKSKFKYASSNILLLPITAMIGTWIISSYYFHTFPTTFIIPNLLIVPFMPLIMIIGISAIVTNAGWIAHIFDWIYALITTIIDWCNGFSFSQIAVDINIWEIIVYVCLVVGLYFLLKSKDKRWWTMGTGVLFITFCISMSQEAKRGNGMIVFNDYRETPIMIYKDGEGVLLPTVDKGYMKDFQQYQRNFMLKNGIRDLKIYNGEDSMKGIIDGKYLLFNSKRITIIDGKISKIELSPNKRLALDIMIITANYYSSIKKLIGIYVPKLIVFSGNIDNIRERNLIKECNNRERKLNCVSVLL